MAGGEPRFGTTATYMRRHDHRATCLSIEIDRLHDRLYNEYQVFSAASVRKWSKFGLACAVAWCPHRSSPPPLELPTRSALSGRDCKQHALVASRLCHAGRYHRRDLSAELDPENETVG